MTPKEKARYLLTRFDLFSTMDINVNKESTLICVDEILISICMCYSEDSIIDYWKEVKEEIEKL